MHSISALILLGCFLDGAKVGQVGSKPANAEKSLLVGRGTSSAHGSLDSPPAKVMAGGAPGVLLRSLVVGAGAVLAFQLVSK